MGTHSPCLYPSRHPLCMALAKVRHPTRVTIRGGWIEGRMTGNLTSSGSVYRHTTQWLSSVFDSWELRINFAALNGTLIIIIIRNWKPEVPPHLPRQIDRYKRRQNRWRDDKLIPQVMRMELYFFTSWKNDGWDDDGNSFDPISLIWGNSFVTLSHSPSSTFPTASYLCEDFFGISFEWPHKRF